MFGYTIFLERAASEAGIERFKLVITFAICMLHLATEQKKPFNPILGETLQANIADAEVYAEQTSHHPPICHFLVIGNNYKIMGHHEFQASTSANSINARQCGKLWIVFGSHKI